MTEREPDPGLPASAGMVELRRELAALRGSKRLDLLLDQPDPAAAVQALPADELFHAIQEAGLADSGDVVALASADQFRTFLDLDGWRENALDPARVLPWLRAARPPSTSSEEEEEAWREKLAAIDPELLTLLLRSTLRIHDIEEEGEPDLDGERCARTPDGRYLVEFVPDGADYLVVRHLLDDMYALDAFQASRRLSVVRWDLEAELAEAALRWRTGRLADLGYPSLEEALSWYARPASRRVAEPAGLPARPPGFWLASHRRGTSLDRAAALLPKEALARFEAETIGAANAVLVADQVDTSDPAEVRGAVESARAILEMGLEALSAGGDEAAAAVLASTPLKVVFQAGFGKLLELRARADRLLREWGGPAPVLDPPLGEAIAAARLRRPRYFPGIQVPRAEWGAPAAGAFGARPFRSTDEVRQTAAALEDAAGALSLARGLGLSAPSGSEASTVAALYLTALANERLGRAFAPVPIPAHELPAAARCLHHIDDVRLSSAGAPGELLATLARNRAAELAPLADGEVPGPGVVTALLVVPKA